VKIALTMRALDSIGEALRGTVAALPPFAALSPVIEEFVRAAKLKTETLRTDPEVFEVWSTFVVASETLCDFEPGSNAGAAALDPQLCSQFSEVLRAGSLLVSSIARARVPMPKSTRTFIERCEALSQAAKSRRDAASRPGSLTSLPQPL
jgi:hypothetical protein